MCGHSDCLKSERVFDCQHLVGVDKFLLTEAQCGITGSSVASKLSCCPSSHGFDSTAGRIEKKKKTE